MPESEAQVPVSNEVPAFVRVLNVNDDAASRYVTTRVLRRAGYEVDEAETGAEGVRKASTNKPHVAVLDVRLPDISGLDVCRALKSDPSTSSILVVQTSASYVTSANRVEGLSAGADAYLTQPFESEELVATISSLLRGRRLEAEARQRAEVLSEANQRKDEFLAMLAHELRNPLSAILTAARLLNSENAPPAPRLAQMIERQTNHLASLVDDLLDVSRITHGKIELKRACVDLNDAVTRAIETCRPRVDRRRQRLHVAIASEPACVDADAVRLEQILCNLLTNASKYTRDEGNISIIVERDDGRARVTVQDDGVGLSRADCARVFDLFYQAETTIARSQAGLGIGLTMAKRLTEMHGGTLTAGSDGVGTGSRFTVELPLVARQTERPSGTNVNPRELSGTRVLLVDDNMDSCEVVQMLLEEAGCIVTTAFDGGEAVRLLSSKRFDVAIVDIGLPVLDGYQVASHAMEALGLDRPKLFALTGYGRAEDRMRALQAGFDEHLVKPVDPHKLTKLVSSGTSGARARVRLG